MSWGVPVLVVVPRAIWGARKPKSVVPMATAVSELWIHHTAGASPPDFPQAKEVIEKRGERSTMRTTQNFHMNPPPGGRGWSDIAYNFIVMPSGRVYRGRGWTRQGAHTEGHNNHSVAICFAGNFELEKPSDKAIKSARQLVRRGKLLRRLTRSVRVGGHRDASGASTACPGRFLFQRLGEIG